MKTVIDKFLNRVRSAFGAEVPCEWHSYYGQMRRRLPNGQIVYREQTRAEADEDAENHAKEAW